MQNLSGLKNLYALHILHFRSDDTCIWVFRELRRFIVDNVAQHPHLPLQYLALKDSVSQLARSFKPPSSGTATKTKKKSKSKSKSKGKGKEGGGAPMAIMGTGMGAGTATASMGGSSGSGAAASAEESTTEADDADDDDEDEVFLANGLKIDTIDGFRFFDVPEVKIFSREIRLGKL